MRKIVSAYILFLLTLGTYAQDQMPAPGQLVEVNGYKLHLLKSGEGGPPVIMFHGAGHIALHWNLVLPEVAQFTTAVAVDQAGEGWSEHGHAIHMWQQAFDTYTALQNAGIKGPYVLVGHSLGGLVTRVFAEMYPDQVAGVVLVDATHPDVVLKIYREGQAGWRRMRETSRNQEIPAVQQSALTEKPELTSVQISRDFGDLLDKFSRADKERFHWIYNERLFSYVKGRSSYEAETMQLIYENPETYGFGDKPLTVISKGIWTDKEGDNNWSNEALKAESERLQKELLKLSTSSRQIIAHNSGHQIHIDEPELVTRTIREMVLQLKGK